MAKDKDILAEAKERFEDALSAWSEVRRAALDDLRFARLGEQWPQDVARQRQLEGRPCLTINRLPTFIRQVVNDARQNKPTIRVRPVDSAGDVVTAEILNGIIRHIESASDADVAYDTLSDLQNAYDKTQNQLKMNAAAGGAFGGGRQGVAEAQAADDYLRNVAGTSANLRSQAFNTAAGLGMQDASRYLQADATNAANALAASQANAANTMANNQFNAQAKQANDAQSIGVINDYIKDLGTVNDIGSQGAQSIYNMGGGANQNLLNYLTAQVPAFGQQQNQTQNTALSGTNSASNGSVKFGK